MNLVADWKKVLLKAHSIRWTLTAGAFGGLEMALPLFADSMPRGRFALAAVLACVGALLARLKAQPEMHDGR